jgi:hypothetical protein
MYEDLNTLVGKIMINGRTTIRILEVLGENRLKYEFVYGTRTGNGFRVERTERSYNDWRLAHDRSNMKYWEIIGTKCPLGGGL